MITPLSLPAVNAMTEKEFCARFGDIVEHAPWVAEEVWPKRPFAAIADLHQSMVEVIAAKDPRVWRHILLSHPELSGREAEARSLTVFSTQEQAGMGLDNLSKEDFHRLREFNARYREKFGFPFVVCVGKLKSLAELFSLQEKRLQQPAAEELHTAVHEVYAIADLRLRRLIEDVAQSVHERSPL